MAQNPARPVGTLRSPALVIIFSIITFGIYTLYWAYKTGKEMKDYSGNGLGGGVSLVIALFIFIVLMFTMPGEVKALYESDGAESPVSTKTGFWFLLPLIGGIIWWVKVQSALNTFWESKGATAA